MHKVAVSIRGCNKKNGSIKPRVVGLKKCYLTHIVIVGYALQLLFNDIFCKVHGLARRGFLVSGGHHEAGLFSNIHENHSQVRFFNSSKFH
jgi:hypothetical protein